MTQRAYGTKAGGGGFSQQEIDAVWAKGTPIPGYSQDAYRRDVCGAVMEKGKRGDTTPGSFGWEIDHIVPVSAGGEDHILNLQPLHWENNRAKSDNPPGAWRCARL